MELAFDTKSLRTICEDEDQAKVQLGSDVAEILKHRLADLRAAMSAHDLVVGRPRVLANDQMTIDLGNDYHLVFQANHVKNPLTQGGSIDFSKVTRIKILRIEREHG